jgi:putative RecB family exonuclease
LTFDPTTAFNEEFDKLLAEHPDEEWMVSGRSSKANPVGEDEGWWRKNGPVMVQRWIDWEQSTPWQIWIAPDGQPGIEIELNVMIDNVQPVKMFVDRVYATAPDNQRPIVLDIKSGSRTPIGDMQLGLYRVGLELQYPGVDIVGGCYWMARTGKVTDMIGLGSYTRQLFAEYMRRLRVAKQMGIYLPNVNSMCKSCKVGRFCAANNGRDSHADPDAILMGGYR